MPYPGTANNNLGINSFSGPMGEKEPAYGAVERASVLSRLAPVGSPAAQNAPKRAKRAAVKQKVIQQPEPAVATHSIPVGATAVPQGQMSYQQELREFWGEVGTNPDASDEVRAYALEATTT